MRWAGCRWNESTAFSWVRVFFIPERNNNITNNAIFIKHKTWKQYVGEKLCVFCGCLALSKLPGISPEFLFFSSLFFGCAQLRAPWTAMNKWERMKRWKCVVQWKFIHFSLSLLLLLAGVPYITPGWNACSNAQEENQWSLKVPSSRLMLKVKFPFEKCSYFWAKCSIISWSNLIARL